MCWHYLNWTVYRDNKLFLFLGSVLSVALPFRPFRQGSRFACFVASKSSVSGYFPKIEVPCLKPFVLKPTSLTLR